MPAPPREVLRVALPVPLPTLFDYLPPAGLVAAPDWIGRRPGACRRGEKIGVVLELGPGATRAEPCERRPELLDQAPAAKATAADAGVCARYYPRRR